MTTNQRLQIAICFFISFVAVAGCSRSEAPNTDTAAPARRADSSSEAPDGKLGDVVSPLHYRLELRIDPSQERFSGTTDIDINVTAALDSLWLHGKGLDVTEAYLTDGSSNRIDASYEQKLDSGVSLVSFERPLTAGPATLHFTYNAAFNTSANALFRMDRDGDSYAATQFEAIAARDVFPGFDEPGFKVSFDVSLVTRADDAAITNTPEASTETLEDGFVRHVFETTRPMPTYLLAFAVGPYDVVDYGMLPPNGVRQRGVHLRGITAKGLGPRINYALKNTDGLLSVLEEYFGSPYPYRKLDIIAVPENFGGAMENIGAITYNEYLVLMDKNSPISQRRTYTMVHAHEMAHMWFGDLVTPAWWNDIWLNESFASWMMNKVANKYWPEGEFGRETLNGSLGAMANDSLASAREIREPIEKNEQINSAFDGITYQKGGGVLAMLERYVGVDKFQAGVRLYMDRHADSVATAEDFISAVAEGSDRTEIEAAFKSFIGQPGVPLLSVSLDCSDEHSPTLQISQSRYAPLGSTIDTGTGQWSVPMCVSYMADGEKKSACGLLNEKQQSLSLNADSCPTMLYPNADGAGYYRFTLDDAGWQQLLSNELDLPATEALVLADSLDAAFRAGKVSAGQYVSGMAALVNHDAWDVADSATGRLENIANIIDSAQLAPVEAAFRRIAKPRFAALGDAEDAATALLRQHLLRFLIVAAKDQEMRKPLARQAAARIGLDGDPDPDAAPASELGTILGVGVQDNGERFFDRLLEQATTSDDPAFRNAAFGALARVEKPSLVQKLQAAILAGRFKPTEAVRMLFRQMARPATTEQTFAWFIANETAIIGMIPESFRSTVLPSLGGSFCSVEKADQWQAMVLSHKDELPGYARSLAQAIEKVHLCAALRDAKAEELRQAFSAYR